MKLASAFRDDRHTNCVRFGKGESISHKLAKCLAGILASEGVAIEDIADFWKWGLYVNEQQVFNISYFTSKNSNPDNQDFIQEARFEEGRRADHWHKKLDKCLEFETDHRIKKKDTVTVYL